MSIKIAVSHKISEDMKAPYYKRVKKIHEKNKKILMGYGLDIKDTGPFKQDKSFEKMAKSAPPGAVGGGSLEEIISEGGNVFRDKEGNALTKRIERKDVEPTVRWLEEKTGLSLVDYMLGTTGKKETSGDLDLAVDETAISKEQLMNKLKQFFPETDVRRIGSNVHLKTPINGEPNNGFVQTDFMFGNPEWLKFSMKGGRVGSEYKGVDKHLLLASIAKAQGYKWSYLHGLIKRETNEVVSKDPNEIAKIIIGNDASEKDMYDVESILAAIKNRKDFEQLVSQAREDFAKKGLQIGETTQLSEAKEEKRIQHAEDIIFWEGSKGALRALELLKNLKSEEGKKSTTIKWDGSPAVIFGRDENGDFIFTDKHGFVAKNYDGKAKSPEQLKDILVGIRRTGKGLEVSPDYANFADKMINAFSVFEKAVPTNHKGFFFGDILYLTKPPVEDGKFVFKPNIVTYKVDLDSEIGNEIAKSNVGVVVHKEIDLQNNVKPVKNYDIFLGDELFVVPPVSMREPVELNLEDIEKVKSFITNNASVIDSFLDKDKLRSMKMTGFTNVLYAYLNSKVDDSLENLGQDFIQWLESNSNITSSAKENIKKYIGENENIFNTMWNIVESIMRIKNEAVAKLDSQKSSIEAFIGDQEGGEGYVIANPSGDVKLVDRSGFTRANRALRKENLEPNRKTVVLLPGSFKPPHKGHFNLIKQLSEKEGVDKVIVLISVPVAKVRSDITGEQAKEIFEIYATSEDLGSDVEFVVSPTPSSVGAAYGFIQNNEFEPNTQVILATSTADAGRFSQEKLDKYAKNNPTNPSVTFTELAPTMGSTDKKVSATDMRTILADPSEDKQKLKNYMPDKLSDEDKEKVISILTSNSKKQLAERIIFEIMKQFFKG